jgi:hypothetical protein
VKPVPIDRNPKRPFPSFGRSSAPFLAEIPCFRELAGNFGFFGTPDCDHLGLKSPEFDHFRPKYGLQEQGI